MKPNPTPDPREWLSALADGDPQALDAGCDQWRDDPQARRTWHAYHLIGDVMRSDELAHAPSHDRDFLAGVRARLASEPVVLSPAASPAAKVAARPVWSVPLAVAAGFVVVAGVLVVARMGPVSAPMQPVEMATGKAGRDAASIGLEIRPVADNQALMVDPRLEEFLRVHQSSGGNMAGVTPGGSLRRVDIVVPVTAGR